LRKQQQLSQGIFRQFLEYWNRSSRGKVSVERLPKLITGTAGKLFLERLLKAGQKPQQWGKILSESGGQKRKEVLGKNPYLRKISCNALSKASDQERLSISMLRVRE